MIIRLWLLLILFTGFFARGQALFGYVYDEAENLPLQGANVYIDGTTINTSTNEKGFFKINIPQGYRSPVIISYIGFESITLDDPSQYEKGVKVLLRESTVTLNEVVIDKNPPFTRKQMLKAFRRQFLGTSRNGNSCKIENEEVILLRYDSKTNTLLAKATEPLHITNKRLQYDINFNLAYFNVDYQRQSLEDADVIKSFYAGTTFFTDVSKNGSADDKRKENYLGSVAHLMKTMASNTWAAQKFGLFYKSFPANPQQYLKLKDTLDLVKVEVVNLPAPKQPGKIIIAGGPPGIDGNITKKMESRQPQKAFDILYNGKEQSNIVFESEGLYIDKNGLFFPITGISFGGYMAKLKAGDLLPIDYIYKD
ncbi:carboxypeptidase-like regulatory domain-containing protein [Flavobacterium rhizosphaerae]|uniref:Carboxypeptidase-like regulatory domain-containing protein n=1 Tax=Flavobacterium rhizosphaerae TaxID=3163298 RepID=A0ABW8YYA0_9FLAO